MTVVRGGAMEHRGSQIHTSPGLGNSSLICLKVRSWPLASKTAALYSLGRVGDILGLLTHLILGECG